MMEFNDLNLDCFLLILEYIRVGERIKLQEVSNDWKEAIILTFRCQQSLQLSGMEPKSRLSLYKPRYLVQQLRRIYTDRINRGLINQINLMFPNLKQLSIAFLHLTESLAAYLVTLFPDLHSFELRRPVYPKCNVNNLVKTFSGWNHLRHLTVLTNLPQTVGLKEDGLSILIENCKQLNGIIFHSVYTNHEVNGSSLLNTNSLKTLYLHPSPRVHEATWKKIIEKNTDFWHELSICLNNIVSIDVLRSLKRCNYNVNKFTLLIHPRAHFTEDDLKEHLSKFQSLTRLSIFAYFNSHLITDSVMQSYLPKCSNIESLFIVGTLSLGINDESIKLIGNHLPQLKFLLISGAKKITDKSCDYLTKLEKLEFFSLSGTGIGDKIGSLIESCSKLQLFDISHSSNVTDSLVKVLYNVAKKRSINISAFIIGCSKIKYFNYHIVPPDNLTIYNRYTTY